jgi:hypothetical protein
MITLFVCLVVLILVVDVLFVVMKTTVNGRLPEGQKLSWWRRDFREVKRNYRELYPDSSLPNVATALWYGLLSIFVVLMVSSALSIYLKGRGN